MLTARINCLSISKVLVTIHKKSVFLLVIAHTELFCLRLEKEDFNKMMKEFPEILSAITEAANLRKRYTQSLVETRKSIVNKDAKLVIRMFNGVANDGHY